MYTYIKCPCSPKPRDGPYGIALQCLNTLPALYITKHTLNMCILIPKLELSPSGTKEQPISTSTKSSSAHYFQQIREYCPQYRPMALPHENNVNSMVMLFRCKTHLSTQLANTFNHASIMSVPTAGVHQDAQGHAHSRTL